MRALVIQLRSHAETVSTERQRQADDVIGINQIVGRRSEVELSEDAADDIQLHTFTGIGTAPSYQSKAVPHANRRNRRPFTCRVVQRAKRAAKKAHKRSGFLRVRENGTEDLILREPYRARGLSLVHACSASRGVDRLRVDTANCQQE
jgi:hypothetical protein